MNSPTSAGPWRAGTVVLAAALMVLAGWRTLPADETSGFRSGRLSGTSDGAETGDPLFTLLKPAETGIAFANKVYEDDDNHPFGYTYFYNGGGVAIGDINNDGLPDLFFTGNMVPNKLYLNKGGFAFEDITDRAAVGEAGGWSNGVTMVDINLDGYLDIYVCRSYYLKKPTLRENLLFINNGDLTFREEAAGYGLNDPGFSVQAAFFDYDGDGDLDMYLGNHYNNIEGYDRKILVREEIAPDFVGDRLMRNNGDGTFADVTEESGIENIGCALGVGIGDLNDDGWPDIYVANDFLVSDVFFINNGDGTFTESIHTALKHSSFFGMGSALADFNNDGFLDIAVTDMLAADNYREKTMMSAMDVEGFRKLIKAGLHVQYMRNTLQLNNGNGTFSEIGYLAGIARTDWSYSVLLADFDNDGWKDMFVANGYRRDARDVDATNVWTGVLKRQGSKFRRGQLRELLDLLPVNRLSNYLFRNNGDLTFTDRTAAFGLTQKSFSSGAAYGDLDNDGDLDLVVTNLMDPVFVYRNESENRTGGNFLRVRLTGPGANPAGIGAKVRIDHNGGIQHQEFHVTRGFHSSVEYALHFGLGDTLKIDSLRVTWPDGRIQEIGPEGANQVITLDHDNAREPDSASGRSMAGTRMREVTDDVGVAFAHRENDYDDYLKEVLLPHKMSQFGPNVAVGDVNVDGRDDFYAGGAAQQAGTLYLQDSEARFRQAGSGPWPADAGLEDVGALFFDADGDGDPDLYVVSGGSAFGPASHLYQDRLYINDGTGAFAKSAGRLPAISASGSCVTAGDYDGDGDLDLFVGGRVLPGKYPLPPKSYLLNNDGGVFTDVTGKVAPDLQEPGLVTSAVWSDYNGDGAIDLIVVGEWMPVSVFQNTGGQLIRRTGDYGLENTTGWWNVVETGDFDNDGDSDYVLGNLGLNYKYKATEAEPLHVYAHDFDLNGSTDIVLGYYNDGVCYPVRGRECSSQQIPLIKSRFPTYAAFGKATLTDVYGPALNLGYHREAKMFASSTMENLGNGRFLIKPLPVEAQFSTVQGIIVQDFDGDSNLDLLIGGNFHVSEVETGRADAGIGLLLTGDGHGNFSPVHVSVSGFMADLDVRDLAAARSADGSSYVLVGNNNDRMQVFRLGR